MTTERERMLRGEPYDTRDAELLVPCENLPVHVADDRDLGPHAGAAGGQCRQPQQHHGSDDFSLDLRSGSGGVRANQAALQLGSQLAGDMSGG